MRSISSFDIQTVLIKMALSQAAYKAEQAMGHGDNAETAQDVTNPAKNREKYGDTSESMKALAWMGKNTVEMGTQAARPRQRDTFTDNFTSRLSETQGHRR